MSGIRLDPSPSPRLADVIDLGSPHQELCVDKAYGVAATRDSLQRLVDKRIHVLLLQLKRGSDVSAQVAFEDLPVDTEDFAVFARFQTTVFWGYVNRQSLHRLYSYTATHFTLPKAFCSGRKPVLDEDVLDVHPSFDSYASVNMPSNETPLAEVESVLMQRLLMFRGQFDSPALETRVLFASTTKVVQLDCFAYFFLLQSITEPQFCADHGLAPDRVFVTWTRLERAITDMRLRNTPLSHLPLPPYAKVVRCPPALVLSRFDSGQEFVSVPFEHAPQHLISGREVVLLGGEVFLPRRHFLSLCKQHASSLHKSNFEALTKHKERYRLPANLVRLKAVVQREFADICGKQPGTEAAVKVGLNDLRSIGPACMQQMLKRAETPGAPHLKYDERLQFARFLVYYGWSVADVLSLWRPMMRCTYRGTGDPADIVGCVKSVERVQAQRKRAMQKVGASCWDLCMSGGCPYKHPGGIRHTKEACMAGVQLQSPQHYMALALKHRESTSSSSSSSSSSSR